MKKKLLITITVIILLIAATVAAFAADFSAKKITWGITFSQPYAQFELGLDWQKAYLAILDDLKVDNVRLSAYWNYIEPVPNVYNFADLDWQINEASQRGIKIILGVGRKLPRWPECHDPIWIKSLSTDKIQERQLEYIKNTVNRYKDNENIIAWQVENEPFLKTFGECPPLDKEFLAEEVKLAKSLSNKPTIVSDSGELSTWLPAGKTDTNFLGTTLYRVVYNPVIGYVHWPVPPFLYYLKSKIVKQITDKEKIFVAELQGESWHKADTNLQQMSLEEHSESMSIEQFQNNIRFAQKAGFDEIYLWGVEWWYFMKEQRGYPNYWEEAKELWK